MKKIIAIAASSLLAAFIFFGSGGEALVKNIALIPTAAAYSVNGQASSSSPDASKVNFGVNFGNLLDPLANFFKSMTSIGSMPKPATQAPPAVSPIPEPRGGVVVDIAKAAFQKFDDWLSGIAGFRISGLFFALLNIFSWLLGMVKAGVDWLLSLFNG